MAKDQIQIEFKVMNDEFKGKISEMKKETTQLNREFKLQSEQMKLSGSQTDKLKSRLEFLNQRYDQSKEKVRLTKEQLEQAKSTFGENSNEVKKLKGALTNAETQQAKFGNQVQLTAEELRKATDPIEQFKNKMNNAGEKFQSTGKKITGVGTSLTKGLTAPIVGAGAGLLALATKSGETADRLIDLSDVTGMSTDAIQEWQHVSVVAGVSQEAMTSAVEGFVKKMPQLAEGTGKSTEALNNLGYSYDDIKNKTPEEQFDLMMKSLAEMEDPLERNAIGAQLFGGSWKELAPILGMGADGIQGVKDEAHELGNVIGNDSLQDANNFRVEMDKMKEAVGKVAMQIGSDLAPILQDILIPAMRDKLVPAIQGLVEKVQNLIQWWSNLSPGFQKFIGIATALAVAIGPIIVGFGSLISAIGVILPVIGAVGGAFMGLTAPIGIAIGVVTAFALLGPIIYKNWDKIKEFFSNLWKKVKEIFSKAFESIKSTSSKGLESVKTVISGILNGIKTVFSTIWNAIKTVVSGVITGISTVVSTGFNAIKTVISGIFNAIKTVTSTIWNGIKSAISGVVSGISSAVSGSFSAIKSTITGVWNTIKSATSTTWNAIKSAITTPINSAKKTVSKAISSIKGFFSNLKLKFPKIKAPKLPKFSVTGKFSLKPPSMPKFGISWKSEGAIFRRPTVLNGIGVGDGYKGVGSGMEAVLPIDKLAGIIQNILPKTDPNPGLMTGATVINFNGNYTFKDKDDVDYFLNESAMKIKRRQY